MQEILLFYTLVTGQAKPPATTLIFFTSTPKPSPFIVRSNPFLVPLFELML